MFRIREEANVFLELAQCIDEIFTRIQLLRFPIVRVFIDGLCYRARVVRRKAAPSARLWTA